MRSIFTTLLYVLFALGLLLSPKSKAQPIVSEDASVSTAVTLDSVKEQFVVTDGTIRGSGLFHSFDDFSPEIWSVLFDLNNAAYDNIDIVISRVTGQQPSWINGSLEIQGGNSPDLFLINPAGIFFGENANLQLPGSFLASTAESIQFGDARFSTVEPEALPTLLSISTPIGLQLNSRSERIGLSGNGHSLKVQDPANPIFSPHQTTAAHGGLTVNAGETLAFVGNGIALSGGVITASDGRVGLISADSATVDLELETKGFSFSVVPTEAVFGDVTLDQRSLVDISGAAGDTGSIASVIGHDVVLENGSLIWSQNRGGLSAGSLSVNAANALSISGPISSGLVLSGILSDTVGSGEGASLAVTAPNITVTEGNLLGSRVFSAGNGGVVTINADELVVDGYVENLPNLFTQVGSLTVASGKAGDVNITARQRLQITQGAYVGASTALSDGAGGDVRIYADDIVVMGATPTGELSAVAVVSIAGGGDAGDLTIETDRLSLLNSGRVLTSSFTDGSAGNIDITATDLIVVDGQIPGNRESTISSGVRVAPAIYRQQFGTFAPPTGDAGEVKIRTNRLIVSEGGSVTVANAGSGQTGLLELQAQDIVLNDGELNAVTATGRGGNINLFAELLHARRGSSIQATSLGTGDGGNIDIDVRFIVSEGNSDIVANATTGRGGNIDIETEGIFGLAFRDRLTDKSDITASSEIGVDGSVEIENTGLDDAAELTVLPTYFSDVDNKVVASCSTTDDNQFVASGRGGLAANPGDRLSIGRAWSDVRTTDGRAISAAMQTQESYTPPYRHARSAETGVLTDALEEAVSWQRIHTGDIELVTGSRYQPIAVSCLPQNAEDIPA